MTTSPLRAVPNIKESRTAEVPESGAPQLARSVTLQRYVDGELVFADDSIAVEADLHVQVEGADEVILSRTPGDDLNLVAGHLFCRSMIRGPEDLVDVAFSYRGVGRVTVTLASPCEIRRLFPSPRPVRFPPERLFELKEVFERRQNLFKNTGSTHAAALFDARGELLSFGEDVGRHNAFDKAIGRSLLEGTLDKADIAVLSSRLALELTVKAATANIPILCGFSAATSSGISYADRNNLTLVGRLRKDSFNLYANGWRIRSR